jgi:cytochrome c peroxidase
MKIILVTIVLIVCISAAAFTNYGHPNRIKAVQQTLEYFKKQATIFATSCALVEEQISKIKKNDPSTIFHAKEALKKCRQQYKSIEFFLSYFLFTSSTVYNQANKVEVEEPFMEYHEPAGLQVMEALLFADDVVSKKKELSEQAALINSSAHDLNALLYDLQIDDKQILESIRLELIRVITLGITGFDTPELKTGIDESHQAMQTIKIILSPFLSEKNNETDSLTKYLDLAIQLLSTNSDFNSFDRLGFLTKAALPLQYHLGLLIKERGLEINTTGVLNYDVKNLFSPSAIKLHLEADSNSALIILGRKLFFEKGLSGTFTRSCATCHQPEKYFTDQIPKSITLNEMSTVERNAPTLFYSADQYSQFWDGRAKNIDEQINTVLVNAEEMGADHAIVIKRLRNAKQYVQFFKSAFPDQGDSAISIHNIILSITAFLETLSPFNSPFDRYMSGDKNALTKQQVKGFNLFMGKAQCGTCHFAPLFNGLIPPLYKRTELEVLGTTKNVDFTKPELDNDHGRFSTFPIIFYKGAFKTPTVRNAEKTAPYMHNGAFPTLEKVLEFYNKGGGAGLGLNVPTQTLSPKPLLLDSSEVKAIINFLHSLTDSYTF